MVNTYLATQGTPGQPVHTWVSEKFAEHPYDFELLAASGAVEAVVDAKATSQGWPGEFQMSAAEVIYAAGSPVPYRIYRVSNVAAGCGGELRVSEDIRPFAGGVVTGMPACPHPGTKVTGVAIHPLNSGIKWSPPMSLAALA